MVYVYAIILTVLNTVWLALNLVGLPGNWLMLIGMAGLAWYTWGTPDQMFGPVTLIAGLVFALVGEVLEFMAGAAGATRAGATRRGAIGALIGGLVGGIVGTAMIPIPVVGSILGACAGAFAGALVLEFSGGRNWSESFRAGLGAGQGRFWGTISKLGVGALLWTLITVAAFWP